MAFDWTPGSPQTLTADGANLEAACWGPSPDRAPTLILLHEGLGCDAMWRGFPQALVDRTGMGVIAFSRQGYGRSDPCALPRPLDYMTDEAVRVIPQILDQIALQRGVLLGHSDGGSIAALFGGTVRDHRVRGLIVMAPHFFVEDVSITAIQQAGHAFDDGDLRRRLALYHADVDTAFRGWNDAWLDPGFREWDISETLAHIQVPVLAIQGRDDAYGTRAQIDCICDLMYAPAEMHLLDACGHTPHLEQPDLTLDLIEDFTERLFRMDGR